MSRDRRRVPGARPQLADRADHGVPGRRARGEHVPHVRVLQHRSRIEIDEAAKIDGAGHARIFFTIILRLVAPILAVVGAARRSSRTFGEYMIASVILIDPENQTLRSGCIQFVSNAQSQELERLRGRRGARRHPADGPVPLPAAITSSADSRPDPSSSGWAEASAIESWHRCSSAAVLRSGVQRLAGAGRRIRCGTGCRHPAVPAAVDLDRRGVREHARTARVRVGADLTAAGARRARRVVGVVPAGELSARDPTRHARGVRRHGAPVRRCRRGRDRRCGDQPHDGAGCRRHGLGRNPVRALRLPRPVRTRRLPPLRIDGRRRHLGLRLTRAGADVRARQSRRSRHLERGRARSDRRPTSRTCCRSAWPGSASTQPSTWPRRCRGDRRARCPREPAS